MDDATLWTLIPGAMRPAYQVTEEDAGKWLRVTVMPLPSSSAGGRGTNSLEARASGNNRCAYLSGPGAALHLETQVPLASCMIVLIANPSPSRSGNNYCRAAAQQKLQKRRSIEVLR